MLNGTITNRYTQGFYAYASEHSLVDAIDKSLHLLANTLDLHPDFKALLEHPLINVDAKVASIKNVLGEQLDPAVLRFLHILFTRGRSAYVMDIARRFRELAQDAQGVVSVEIESARPLSDAQTAQIERELSTVLEKKANAFVQVNPELIAGYRVRLGNQVLDATISGALAQFSEKLLTGTAI